MTKLLVVSDSHTEVNILSELYRRYQATCDYFLHCGDSQLPLNHGLWEIYQTVQGNCDLAAFPKRRILELPEGKIFLTHGHLYQVKMGMARLQEAAREADCDLALFGHSHIATYVEGAVSALNPGSISQPRGPISHPTYAIVDWQPLGIEVHFYTKNHELLDELVK